MSFALTFACSAGRASFAARRPGKILRRCALLFAACVIGSVHAEPLAPAGDDAPTRQFTYTWSFIPDSAMAPRGGTTDGAAVNLITAPSSAWLSLQTPGLSKQEKDRRAILAMAGPYRASFDFIETMGFNADYQPPAPYRSWGTEYVYVVADEPEFVSLQHILVMFIQGMEKADGSAADPVVVKHWRQDWRYQQRDSHPYVGHSRWRHTRAARDAVKGTWTQTVYQVDDSPRYAAQGTWQHTANFSSWRSQETWRPLPRREFSVRDDYHALVGFNRHTLTPTGWTHSEDNKKVVLDAAGNIAEVIAVEAGFNRYERIVDHDWRAGDTYWQETGPFWAQVRQAWSERLSSGTTTLLKEVDGRPLFAAMFELATKFRQPFDAPEARIAIARTLDQYTRR